MLRFLALCAVAASLCAQDNVNRLRVIPSANASSQGVLLFEGTSRADQVNLDTPSAGILELGDGTLGHSNGQLNLGKLNAGSDITSAHEIQSTMGTGDGQFRLVNGSYGALLRNDGSDTYLLFTGSGTPYGTFNTLRPFAVNDSTGNLTLGNGAMSVVHGGDVSVANNITIGGTISTGVGYIASGGSAFILTRPSVPTAQGVEWYVAGSDVLHSGGWVLGTDTSGNFGVLAGSSGGTQTNVLQISPSGNITGSREIQTVLGTGDGQFRAVSGSYGALLRNDGTDTYLLLTNSGSPYGTFNSLRPFRVADATGNVSMGNGALVVAHGADVSVANNLGVSGGSYVGSSSPIISGATSQVHSATDQNLTIRGAVTVSGATTIESVNDTYSANVPLEIRANPTVILGGNIGVGTSTPADLLDVAGTIRSTRFAAVGTGQLELQLVNLGSGADQKYTELIEQSGVFQGRFMNDAYTSGDAWMYVHRNSGTYTTDKVTFPNGTFAIGTDSPASGAKTHIHAGTDENFTVRSAIGITGAVTVEAVNDAYTTNVPMEFRASSINVPFGEVDSVLGSLPSQFRAVSGHYGSMIRNDDSSTYLLVTNYGAPYASFNTLRPFAMNNSTGDLTLGDGALVVQHGADVSAAHNLTVSGYLKSLDGLATALQYSGCDPTGATSSTTCLNAALAANAGKGLRIPSGTYLVGKLDIPDNIVLSGDGPATKLIGDGTVSAYNGIIDINNRTDVTIQNLMIDGQVTSPTGVTYSSILSTGPITSTYLSNNSIAVHGGTNITIADVKIAHTGGEAIFLDFGTYDGENIRIVGSTFEDNRPFIFGDTGDQNYGGWFGGIMYYSASSHSVTNLTVAQNTFKRIIGHGIFGYAVGSVFNQNVIEANNHFESIGLDSILNAGVSGLTVQGNTILYNGFVSLSDGARGTPKWYRGTYGSIPGVGIDSADVNTNLSVTGNTVIYNNGGGFDLDGASYGVFADNRVYIPSSADPDYDSTIINGMGPAGLLGDNYMYGLNTGNTNNTAEGASDIEIAGNTFYWQGGGAIRGYAGRDLLIMGNKITAPDNSNGTTAHNFYFPITLGNIGTGTNQRATNNTVSKNKIHYAGSTLIDAVFEDANGTAFTSSQVNQIYDNELTGNLTQFAKDSGSSSVSFGQDVQTASGTSVSRYSWCNASSGSTAINCLLGLAQTSGGVTSFHLYTGGGTDFFDVATSGLFLSGSQIIATASGHADIGNVRNIVNSGTLTTTGNVGFGGTLTITGAFSTASTVTATSNISGGSFYVGATQVITGSRNVGNVVDITASGTISGNALSTVGTIFAGSSLTTTTYVNATTGLYVNGTQVIDSGRNIVNAGGGTFSSGLSASGFNPTGYSGGTATNVAITNTCGALTAPCFSTGGFVYQYADFRGGVITSLHN